jgi:hypothetical protein
MNRLMIWSSWVDDILSCGNQKEVVKGRQELKKLFDLDEAGEVVYYAKDPVTRKSVSGWAVFLHGVPFIRKSKMQKYLTLRVTEAECVAAVSYVQDMLHGKPLLESMGLKVKLPMVLHMDNNGGVDLFNSWSVAENTTSISVRLAYIRELRCCEMKSLDQ